MADQIVVEFDVERKLVVKHRFVREAVRTSGRSVSELLGDPFGGWPFLVMALVNAKTTKQIDINKASDLIDEYREKNKGIKGLADSLGKLFSDYVSLEATPTEDEVEDAEAKGTVPNAASPVAPGLLTD